MNDRSIETAIRDALSRITGEDAHGIHKNDDLSLALGLDSLGRLELLSEMEEHFDLVIYDLDSEKTATIGGMMDVVTLALQEKKEVA